MSEVFSKFTLSLKQGGGSLTLRAETLTELEAMTKEAEVSSVFSVFVTPGPTSIHERNAVQEMVEETDKQAAVDRLLDEKKAEAATGLTGDEAQAAVAKHLGAGEELASPTQIAAAVKKSGKTAEELAGISVNEAKRLIKEGAK